jgi:hypothetical protein
MPGSAYTTIAEWSAHGRISPTRASSSARRLDRALALSRLPEHASRGEFTVAKEMNVRLRSGWFSERAVCYLAAGRPVVEQDTAFCDVLPCGPGLHAFNTPEQAAAAIRAIEADYLKASAHATHVARESFAAERVLGRCSPASDSSRTLRSNTFHVGNFHQLPA